MVIIGYMVFRFKPFRRWREGFLLVVKTKFGCLSGVIFILVFYSAESIVLLYSQFLKSPLRKNLFLPQFFVRAFYLTL